MSNEAARKIALYLGAMVNEDQISPPEVMIGATHAIIAFWMGCVKTGTRAESLDLLRACMNEEIDYMLTGIADGMVPA